MHRSAVLPFSIVLALVTTGVLVRTAAVLEDPTIAVPASETLAAHALVRRFYDAVETVLRTGDATPLDAVLHPDFVDHAPQPNAVPGRPTLARSLVALRAAFPDLRLTVEEMTAAEDRVLVRVSARAVDRGPFLGLPLLGPAVSWETVDRFRLATGRVAEYWAGAGGPAGPRLLTRATLAVLPSVPVALALARWTYPPGVRVPPLAGPGPVLLLVEEGRLTVHLSGDAELVQAATTAGASGQIALSVDAETTLSPGDLLVVPGAVPYAPRNDGTVHAVVLQFTVFPTGSVPPEESDAVSAPMTGVAWLRPVDDGPGQVDWPPGVAVRSLGGGVATRLPAGTIALTGGRLTLGPNETITAHPVAGIELLVVEGGVLGLTAGPEVWMTRGGGLLDLGNPGVVAQISASGVEDAMLLAGDAALLQGGTVQAIRNAGEAPLVVLVLTIGPAAIEGVP